MPKSKQSVKCEEKILNVDLKRSGGQKIVSRLPRDHHHRPPRQNVPDEKKILVLRNPPLIVQKTIQKPTNKKYFTKSLVDKKTHIKDIVEECGNLRGQVWIGKYLLKGAAGRSTFKYPPLNTCILTPQIHESSHNTKSRTPQAINNSQTSDQQTPKSSAEASTDKKRTDPKSSETVPPGNKLKVPENPFSQNNNDLTSQTSDLTSLQLYGSSQIADQNILQSIQSSQTFHQQTPQPNTEALTGSKRRKAYTRKPPIVPCPENLQKFFLPRKDYDDAVYEAEKKLREKEAEKSKAQNKVSGLQQASRAKLMKSDKERPLRDSKESGVREPVSSGNKLKVQKNPPSKNNEQYQTRSVVKKQVRTGLRNKKSSDKNGKCSKHFDQA